MRMRSELTRVGVVLLCLSALGGCGKRDTATAPPGPPPTLKVSSPALQEGQPIPAAYACTNQDHLGKSPPLSWTKGPEGTVGYAISMVDPDAGNFVHWFVAGIPPNVTDLPEGASPGGTLPSGALELPNDFDKKGYGGPCPPPGPTHRYIVQVWALKSDVPARKADAELFQALVKGSAATGSLTVTYQR
jgi:Raf kinase inhibitor-like YbhB/YbcL family protein